jgi:hypothetical protein
VVADPTLVRAGTARVHGYCAELARRPSPGAPEEHRRVSDHCPVTVDPR